MTSDTLTLKPQGSSPHAQASRAALRAYANFIEGEDAELAFRLRRWADREADAAYKKGVTK